MSPTVITTAPYSIRYEVGSEETNPEAAKARTRDNYESIKVALVDDVAIRIAPDGYRILFRTTGERFYTWAFKGNRTFGLPTKAAVVGALSWLVSEAKITPGTAARAEASLSSWPEEFAGAWHLLNRGPGSPLPSFAPEGFPQHV